MVMEEREHHVWEMKKNSISTFHRLIIINNSLFFPLKMQDHPAEWPFKSLISLQHR